MPRCRRASAHASPPMPAPTTMTGSLDTPHFIRGARREEMQPARPGETHMPKTRGSTRREVLARLAAAGAIGASGMPVLAQGDPAANYPGKPIRIVVGFGPGG